MSLQLALRIAGIAALVVAVAFAVLAIHYFVTRDIRSVMDDLSGKTRARGVAGTRHRSDATARREARARKSARAVVTDAPATNDTSPVDEIADKHQTSVPHGAPTAFAVTDDDAPTLVGGTSPSMAPPSPDTPHKAHETEGTKASPAHHAAAQDEEPPFRVIRSIVLTDCATSISEEV